VKTLLIHNSYQQPGGEDIVFAREAALLREHGHTVVTYTRSNAEVRDFSPAAQALLPLRIIWARDAVRDLSTGTPSSPTPAPTPKCATSRPLLKLCFLCA